MKENIIIPERLLKIKSPTFPQGFLLMVRLRSPHAFALTVLFFALT
jgi:hypothetical protein